MCKHNEQTTNGECMIDILQNGFNIETLIYLSAFIVAVLISITVHEFAHGYVAYNLGDDTAKSKGRLTLNPFAHFDLVGFLSLLLLGFGWAKPVPINPLKFKEFNKGIFLTSVAGVITNIFLAFFCSAIYVAFTLIPLQAGTIWFYVVMFFANLFYAMTSLNIVLALFNLLPIPPLDGFNLVCSLSKTQNKYLVFMQKYGRFVLIAFLILSATFNIIGGAGSFVANIFIDFWGWLF